MTCKWNTAAVHLAAVLTLSLFIAPVQLSAAERFRVYVSNEQDGTVSVIDGETLTTVGTIPVGKRPRGIRPSPTGDLLYVALSGSPVAGPKADENSLPPPDKAQDGIGIVDVAEGKLIRVLRGVSDPEQAAISPDGKTIYVSSEDTGQVLVMDAQNGAILASIDTGGEPEGVRVSYDGRFVLATAEAGNSVTLIDASSHKILAMIPVGQRPRDAVFSPDSKFAYVSGEADATVTLIDIEARSVLSKVKIDGAEIRPMGLALSSGGSRLFVSAGRGGVVAALNAKTLAVLGRAKAGTRPWGIALSPDGTLLFTANGPSNDVSVFKADTLDAVKTIPAGLRPWGVAVIPLK
ncbi:MAG: beta-propeller fold lactonase family protein [Rhodomicrobium sp.]